MLNFVAKCLLVSTSLSPVLGAVAVDQIARGSPWKHWIWWIATAVVLICLCWILLRYAAKNAQTHSFHVSSFERKEQEVLTFLFIYLLPFIRSENSTIFDDWLISTYVLCTIVIAIVYASAFHFNPVMRIAFGYRFYSVKDPHGVPNLLISRTDLRRVDVEIRTVKLAGDVHLDIGT